MTENELLDLIDELSISLGRRCVYPPLTVYESDLLWKADQLRLQRLRKEPPITEECPIALDKLNEGWFQGNKETPRH